MPFGRKEQKGKSQEKKMARIYTGFRITDTNLPALMSGNIPGIPFVQRVALIGRDKTIIVERSAHAIIGIGWGDESKGQQTYNLCLRVRDLRPDNKPVLCCRFCDSSTSSGHRVYTLSGKDKVLNQLPAGMLVYGVTGVLAKLVNLEALYNEIDRTEQHFNLKDLENNFKIFEDTSIVFGYNVSSGRIKETHRRISLLDEYGSIGRGTGDAIEDKERGDNVTIKEVVDALSDTSKYKELENKIKRIAKRKKEEAYALMQDCPQAREHFDEKAFDVDSIFRKLIPLVEKLIKNRNIVKQDYIKRAFDEGASVIFEGSQSPLLGKERGPYPYTVKTNTEANQIETYSGIPLDQIEIIGVTRAYDSRHAYAPFVPEITEKDLQGKITPEIYRKMLDSNPTGDNPFYGPFRAGWFDFLRLKHAIYLIESSGGKVGSIIVTNLDRLNGLDPSYACRSYKNGEEIYNQIPYNLDSSSFKDFLWGSTAVITPLKGWNINPRIVHDSKRSLAFRRLPDNVHNFFEEIQDETDGIPVSAGSIGIQPSNTLVNYGMR